MRPHFPNIQESYRISLRIHHNVENTGCHAATQHLFVDWDMTPLRQCSQRCSAGYGSGQASSSTGCSPYGLPFIGRSCGLCCEARCLSSGCFKELHFITTVRALDAFKPSPIRENALTCCVVMTGADLRLAVISDSHGRLIAPPNSSFPQ
ncbi:putative lipoprotein [Escherichia coli]|nr:putative lipoprotein [Escherichia coli]SQS95764.1 putative lipoprotein [Escherichia coli]